MLTQKDLDEIKQLIHDELDEKIKFLPTKDDFYTKMDEVMGELRDLCDDWRPNQTNAFELYIKAGNSWEI